jgi:hypothetical protein
MDERESANVTFILFQDVPDQGKQSIRLEWLLKENEIGASLDLVTFLNPFGKPCTHKNDRNAFHPFACSELVQECEATHARQEVIEYDELGSDRLHHVESRKRIYDRDHLIGCGFAEKDRYKLGDIRIVLDDEHRFA